MNSLHTGMEGAISMLLLRSETLIDNKRLSVIAKMNLNFSIQRQWD